MTNEELLYLKTQVGRKDGRIVKVEITTAQLLGQLLTAIEGRRKDDLLLIKAAIELATLLKEEKNGQQRPVAPE